MIISLKMLETVGILILLGILAIILYRLTVHPLAKYPGPLLGKITDWYTVYHAWKGDRHLDFYQLHQRHGKFVRYGPNRISINSNSALQEIYGPRVNVQKSQVYGIFREFFDSFSTHTTINKVQHGRRRRILSQSLSEAAVKSMESLVVENVQIFCDYLDEPSSVPVRTDHDLDAAQWSSSKDMANWFSYLAFDIMGHLCFGRRFDTMVKEDNRGIQEILCDGSQALIVIGHMPSLLKLRLHGTLFRKLINGLDAYKAHSSKQAQERLGKKTPERDIFSYLLDAKDPETGEGFSESELTSESSLLIIAGSDTTATTLAATCFYLLHNPSTLETLTHEIRSTFQTLEDIHSGPQLSSCRYLRACIDEALRLSPPVGALLPRVVLPGGATIDDHHFPAGIDVGTPIYAIHHDEAYYSDPFEYKPSRWLGDPKLGTTEEEVALARSAFCPFSLGPRGCVGKALAYAELGLILARVVWLFEMRLAGEGRAIKGDAKGPTVWGREREYHLVDKFVGEGKGPLVEFRPRIS